MTEHKRKPLGGQAIVEGVLIKAPDKYAMAVRLPNKKIKTKQVKSPSLSQKHKIFGWPLVRGVANLIDMLILGIRALTWSANQQGEEEELGMWEWLLTFGIAIALTVGLFVLLPYYAAAFFLPRETILFDLLDGLFRLLIFLAYLLVIGLSKDVQRMFQYHGAEHMAVHCYEHGKQLSVKNVRGYPPEHPRCGTSLLFFVVVVSIVLFSVVRTEFWYYNLIARVLLIPVVAALSYEILKLTAKYPSLAILTYPGIIVQKLTTRKPKADQIEVAIAAVEKAQ